MHRWAVFDIETAPLPEEELVRKIPKFDPESVKLGRIKDPEKIEKKIEEARKSHIESHREMAGLDPSLSTVLVVGMYSVQKDEFFMLHDDERHILRKFWSLFESCRAQRVRMAGLNIFNFDLPYMVRRSWCLEVPVPAGVFDPESKWESWSKVFFDIRRCWQLGDRMAKSNFDLIGRSLGTGGKMEGDHGATFWRLWNTDRDVAMKYLRNDCVQPAEWLKRMGLIREDGTDA